MTPLESMSAVFDPLVIPTAMPKGRRLYSGVYLLVYGDEIVYVGSSAEVEMRVWAHANISRTDEIQAKTFDRALWYTLPSRVLMAYEGAFIRALLPRYNSRFPQHVGWDNEILEGFGLPPHADEYANAASAQEVMSYRRAQTKHLRRAAASVAADPVASYDDTTAGRIRHWRTKRGLSKSALARACFCTKQAVAFWEQGRTPGPENLARVATVLGVEIADLSPPTKTSHAVDGNNCLQKSQSGSSVPGAIVQRLTLRTGTDPEAVTP